MTLDRDVFVIDWIEFVQTCLQHNWKLKGTLLKIENSLTEIYGKEYSLEIINILNKIYKEEKNV